jgi:hypothetical protein
VLTFRIWVACVRQVVQPLVAHLADEIDDTVIGQRRHRFGRGGHKAPVALDSQYTAGHDPAAA